MSLQGVTLQFPSEPECLELEQIAAGYHVVEAFEVRNMVRRDNRSEELQGLAEGALWRRVTELCEARCKEILA